MADVHLFHGINVSDGGVGSVGGLVPYLSRSGLTPHLHAYGWTGPLRVRFRNRRFIRGMADRIEPDSILVGHSNGALICFELAQVVQPKAVVIIQAALRRDTVFPGRLPVLCLHNRRDHVVQIGRAWGRLASVWKRHGWGAAGHYGLTEHPNTTNWDTLDIRYPRPAAGHSAVLREPAILYWGPMIAHWCAQQVKP